MSICCFTAFRGRRRVPSSPIGCFSSSAANGLRLLSPAIKVGATIQVDQPNPIATTTTTAHSYQTTRRQEKMLLVFGPLVGQPSSSSRCRDPPTSAFHGSSNLQSRFPTNKIRATVIGRLLTVQRLARSQPSAQAESPKRVAPVLQLLIEWPITCSQQPEQQQHTHSRSILASTTFIHHHQVVC